MLLLKLKRYKTLLSYLLAGMLLYLVVLSIVLIINIFYDAISLNLHGSLQFFCYCLLISILVAIPVHFLKLENNWIVKLELAIVFSVLFNLFINRNVEVGFQGLWVLNVIIGILLGVFLFIAQLIVKKYLKDKF